MQFPHQPSMQVYAFIPMLTYRPDAPMHNRLPVWLLQTFKACLHYQYGNINPCYHCKYIVLIIIMLQQREGRPAPLPSLMIPFKIPLLFPLSPFLSNEVHLFFTFPARPLWIFPSFLNNICNAG